MNEQLLIHPKPSNRFLKIQSIKYKEIKHYTRTVIQARFENTYLEKEISYVIVVHCTFIDITPNLKCYATFINKATL